MGTKKLDLLLDGLGVFLINFVLALLFVGVLLRYIFKVYFPFGSEFPVDILPVMVFLLIGILWKRKTVIILDAVYIHLGRKTKYVLDVIYDVGGIVAAVIWAVGSIQLVFFDLKFSQLTGEMFVNFAYYHAPFALGLLLFAFYVIVDFVKLITRRQVKEP